MFEFQGLVVALGGACLIRSLSRQMMLGLDAFGRLQSRQQLVAVEPQIRRRCVPEALPKHPGHPTQRRQRTLRATLDGLSRAQPRVQVFQLF